MEWKEYNICELCDTISDTYKGKATKVVLINTSDVLDGKCLTHELSPNENLKGQFKKTFRRDDILYSEIRPANRRFAYIDFDATDYIASTKLMVLRHKEFVDPRFLYQILRSSSVVEELQMLAESRSGTFPQITYSELANITVSLPNLAEQKRIVAILSSLDDKIENNRRVNKNLEEQAQTLFKSWFVDFEPFKDGEFVDSELGMIPKGWRVGKLGELIYENEKSKIQVGQARGLAGEFPFFTSGTAVLEYPQNMVDGRNIFLNTGGNADVKYFIGPAAYSTDTWSVYGVDGATDFLYIYLKSITDIINVQYFEGSALKHLKKKNLLERDVIIPSKDVMEAFLRTVSPVFDLMMNLRKESRRLAQLRDALLPKLMNGEIEL